MTRAAFGTPSCCRYSVYRNFLLNPRPPPRHFVQQVSTVVILNIKCTYCRNLQRGSHQNSLHQGGAPIEDVTNSANSPQEASPKEASGNVSILKATRTEQYTSATIEAKVY